MNIHALNECLSLRQPQRDDGAAMYDLIRRCPPLDINSAYLYCILADHHGDCCIVADDENLGLVGCVTGYRIPDRPDTIFIWQVAVDQRMRGVGLAGKMMEELLARPALGGIQAMETTISPDNAASRRAFQKLAEARGATINEVPYLVEGAAGEGHAAENLLRIESIKRT